MADGGNSFIEWPVELGDGLSDDALDPVVVSFSRLYGIAKLDEGKSPYSPYVNIGFNVAGFDSNGVALSTDISDWNGLCIAYSIATPFDVVLDLGDSLNKKLEYALPAVSLPKSHFGVVECVSWDDFDMPDWARDNEYKITGEEAAKHVVRIVFRIRNQPGSYDFNIYAIGTNLD